MIKYALIADKQFFTWIKNNVSAILKRELTALEKIIQTSAAIKAKIVSIDETEQGLRAILNFGHTLGHAIEAAAGYKKYNHGEAISVGMLIAAQISKKYNLIQQATFKRIENLIRAVGLPVNLRGLSLNKILASYHHDKKFIGGRNRLVLIKGIGKTVIKENIAFGIIKDSLIERLNLR